MQLDYILLMFGRIDGQLQEHRAHMRDHNMHLRASLQDVATRIDRLEQRQSGLQFKFRM